MAMPEAEMYITDAVTTDAEIEESVTEDGFNYSAEVTGGSASDDSAPLPMPDAPEATESQFSVTVQVTDVNELYKKMGYTERFYSVSRLNEPTPEAFDELISSGDATQIFKSLYETHYKVPMAALNELDPEVFTEIVFDDLTAQYGLVILMTAEE